MREEHDSLGSLYVDDNLYYGIQTIRNTNASNVTGLSHGCYAKDFLICLAQIKKAAAMTNAELGVLDEKIYLAITEACDEVIAGKFFDQFPVDILTGGGGVGIHMNMNEVLANRANEILCQKKGYNHVHPNTHVNMGQSTNDVVPSAMHLFFYQRIEKLLQSCESLKNAFLEKSQEHNQSVKLGRTCLQDALPLTFGQEFSAHASFLERQEKALNLVKEECLSIPLGATAVGTGVGTSEGYFDKVYKHLNTLLNYEVKQSENLFDALMFADFYSRIAFQLKALAAGLSKIASDLRLQSSGPRSGIGELTLPEILPGSSIMPGKINPTIPELIIQIYFQVSGHEHTVSLAAERGDLNLNVWEAVILKSLLESFDLLERGIKLFNEQCIQGIQINKEKCKQQAKESTALAAAISTVYGYSLGAELAKTAKKENKTIADIVVEKGILSKEEAEELLNPLNLTNAQSSYDLVEKLRAKHKNLYKTAK